MNVLPTVTLLLVGVSLVLVSGCTPQAAPDAVRSRASGTISVRPTDAYRRAAALYRAGDYAAALQQVNALLADASTDADRRYLLRQQSICQNALLGKAIPSVSDAPTKPVPVVDTDSVDCGPRALLLACDALPVRAEYTALLRAARVDRNGTTFARLKEAAHAVGVRAEGVQMDEAALRSLRTPAVAWVDGNHFVALTGVAQNPLTGEWRATIHDPRRARPESITLPALLSRGGGVLLTLRKESR